MGKWTTYLLKLTPEEMAAAKAAARGQGLTLAEWIRRLLFPDRQPAAIPAAGVAERVPEVRVKGGGLPVSKWCVPCQRAGQIRWNCRECKR